MMKALVEFILLEVFLNPLRNAMTVQFHLAHTTKHPTQ